MTWQVGTSLGPLRNSKPHKAHIPDGSAGSPSPAMYVLSQWAIGQAWQEGGVAQSVQLAWWAKASLRVSL